MITTIELSDFEYEVHYDIIGGSKGGPEEAPTDDMVEIYEVRLDGLDVTQVLNTDQYCELSAKVEYLKGGE